VRDVQVSDKDLIAFLRNDLGSDIKTVPGIGPAAEKKMVEAGVRSPIQLVRVGAAPTSAPRLSDRPLAPPVSLRVCAPPSPVPDGPVPGLEGSGPERAAALRACPPAAGAWGVGRAPRHFPPPFRPLLLPQDRFWHWLKGVGISAYRSGIVKAIAEKANALVPGIYDEAALATVDEADEDE
jgi:hypothetical protein